MEFTKTNIDRLMTNFFNDEWKGKPIEDMTIFLNAFWEHYSRDMYSILSLDLEKYGQDFYSAIWSDVMYDNLEEKCRNKPLHIYYIIRETDKETYEDIIRIQKEKSDECDSIIATALELPFDDKTELVLDRNNVSITDYEMTINEYLHVFGNA